MKTVFVVVHSYQDFDCNNYSDVVGVWQDQTKAQEFCNEMESLQNICANFADVVNANLINLPSFSKPEPIRDNSLLIKVQELDAIDPKSKEAKEARKNWMRYIDPFQRQYETWSKEKFVFDQKVIENTRIAKRNLFIEKVSLVKGLSPDQITKIVEMYELGFNHYSEDSIYEYKETVYHV